MAISFVDTDGGRLAVDVEGDGPLVLCSPAMGDTRDAFAPLSRRLVSQGYRVARIDLRGHGDSSATFKRYGDEPTSQDILAVVDALGGGPAVIAGASMSAGAAVLCAARQPDRIAALILLGGFLRNSMTEPMRRMLQVALLPPWGPYVWRAQATKLWPGLGESAPARAKETTKLLTRPGRWAAFRATVAGADHRVVAPSIGHVRAPVLVVMGEADPDWKEPLKEAAWIASNFTDASVIAVPDAGHAPMLERPEIVASAVLPFLERLNLGTPSGAGNA